MKDNLFRSLLYVPGHREDLLTKSMKGDADIVVLDLEDSVPFKLKNEARKNINGFNLEALRVGKSLAVRINSIPEMIPVDIESIVRAGVNIIVAPKVDEVEHVNVLVNQISKSLGGRDKDISIIAMIESPKGIYNANAIAHSHPWVVALNLGTEDFSLEMGMEPSWDSLLYPSQQIILAAKAAGKLALGYSGSIAEFQDINLFSSIVNKSAKLGFDGGFAIHPKQIAPLNTAFSPKESDIALAQRIVSAFDEAMQQGNGAVSVDGKMVDRPVAIRAQVILERARKIASKESSHELVSH